jgi:DNA (cytosine-5)-methyltransferase 1
LSAVTGLADSNPSSRRPRILDLFCGAGGAAMGYHRAGFDLVGVDIAPQPNYPFAFVQVDALDYLAEHGRGYHAIHASPPCQAYSDLKYRTGADYPDLVGRTRELLEAAGQPYVIENVEGAPLVDPVVICGSSLGLGVANRQLRRHRLFETNWPLLVPPCAHAGRPVVGVYGTGGGGQMTRGFKARGVVEAREALGTPWMTMAECAQAVPPAYTELIGWQLLQQLEVAA